MGCSKSSSKREVYSNTNLPQETRNISNKKPNLIPKAIREIRTRKTQSWQKERNHKDQIRNKLKRFGGDQIADIKNRKRWNTSKMGRITDQKRELGESEKNDIKKDNRNT